jgi:hypothetical protein
LQETAVAVTVLVMPEVVVMAEATRVDTLAGALLPAIPLVTP